MGRRRTGAHPVGRFEVVGVEAELAPARAALPRVLRDRVERRPQLDLIVGVVELLLRVVLRVAAQHRQLVELGERVDVALPIGNRDAIIIPKSYIITRDGFDFVMLLKGDKAFEIPVQRGQSISNAAIKDGVEILSGLEINDVIVAKAK